MSTKLYHGNLNILQKFKLFLQILSGFKDPEMQLNALKYLWYLLPDSNRDTLQCLLCFLSKVAKFAEDTTNENDQIVSHRCVE